MSDSDDDSLPNNVFTYQNENMTICARGPNVNSANITGSSFRNNVFSHVSHSQMPVNFGRQRYAGSNFDQRSMYYRRETSPMSLRSVPDFGPNFNHSTYRNGIGYQRSMLNGRGGSVMSDRSIDSTASVSVADIAFAFKNRKFSRHEMMILKEAYSKLIKSRQRKRIEKRRNMRLFLKGTRRKSGDESSERETDSSMSNDDCRSIKSTLTKEVIPGLRNMRNVTHYNTNLEKQNENELFRDCTDSIKQNTMRNMFSRSCIMTNLGTREKNHDTSIIKDQNQSTVQNTSVMTQKERFTKGFVLPSQRFNKSAIGQAQTNNKAKMANARKEYASKVAGPESDCDSDEINEIFPRKETQQDLNGQRKRLLDTEGACYSDKKKSKLNSPNRLRSKPQEPTCNTNSNSKSNDFVFAKPKMPIKKCSLRKDFGPEKLLAKSNVPPIAEADDFNTEVIQHNVSKPTETNEMETAENDTHPEIQHSTSDVSMRPSFIKRKLFTQKLDVAENKNLSCDSIAANSPQNNMREKNKARKLVTSQSCLSRDVMGEDNNVLDLIHKIVPPDQINLTTVANKTELCNSQSNRDSSEKWDVTAVISNGNFQDVSDTYTDEEIFNPPHQEQSKKTKNSVNKLKEVQQCKIVVDKLKQSTVNKLLKENNNYELPHYKLAAGETNKKRVTDCVKSFWDTDFESDVENHVATTWKTNIRKNQVSTTQKRESNQEDKLNISNKKPSVSKGILTLRNFHKDSKLSVNAKSQTNVIDRDKKVTEVDNSKSVVVGKVDVAKVGKSKETNTKSQTGNKKKDIAKENVPVTKKQQESGRTPKSKVCTDCVNTVKPKDTTKKLNTGVKLNKKQGTVENDKQIANSSISKSKVTGKTTQKPKGNKNTCTPPSKQAKKDPSKKVANNASNNDEKPQKPVVNVRVQPKRKSKEKSFLQSPKPKTSTNNTKAQSKKATTKSAKESASKHISLNTLNTRSTRSSREKLSFNSSGCDKSSMNISNISNRSLRWRQRKINEYK
ncbi:uncharacterized protein [Epargyreus clarus]|uniref:uncharacterized protein n=1 Tax=Epargyreus clarus TaxID=520877 RepID=UPI003C2DFBAD